MRSRKDERMWHNVVALDRIFELHSAVQSCEPEWRQWQ
jgi:hypothetical protein